VSTDDAWAAGYIDGEGCIHVAFARNRGYTHQSLRLVVTSTVVEPLYRLQRLYEGCVSGPLQRGKYRPQWRWTTTGSKALRALAQMLPYLSVKRAEAIVALEYPVGFRGVPGGVAGVPPDAKVKREEIRQRLQELKRVC